jgi:hypothetical protein
MNNLKSMSVDKLTALREQVEAVLGAKVLEERRTLEERLASLGRLTGNGSSGKRNGGGVRGAVAPKYRNPDNLAENMGGAWAEAAMACRGVEGRWEAGRIQHRGDGEEDEDDGQESSSEIAR